MCVRLLRAPIDVGALMRRAADPRAGAVAVFVGTVREGGGALPLEALEYSAYEEMALREMRRLREETLARFGACEVLIEHRLGRLPVGEVSVAIVVSAPHRDEAFAACRHVIDALKATVPIWKREIWSDGTAAWAGPAGGE